MANSQDDHSFQHPDLLAAVVLHILVSGARDGMTVAAVALACQRDPDTPRDLDEVTVALEILLKDGLVERENAPRSEPDATRKSGVAQPDIACKRDTRHEPDILPQPIYRPTRAAIRAHELSF